MGRVTAATNLEVASGQRLDIERYYAIQRANKAKAELDMVQAEESRRGEDSLDANLGGDPTPEDPQT